MREEPGVRVRAVLVARHLGRSAVRVVLVASPDRTIGVGQLADAAHMVSRVEVRRPILLNTLLKEPLRYRRTATVAFLANLRLAPDESPITSDGAIVLLDDPGA